MRRRGERIGYTTVQTRLERLVEKRAVAKSTERPAQYQAAVQPGEVSAPLLNMLLERVSGAAPLIAHLGARPVTQQQGLRRDQAPHRRSRAARRRRRPRGEGRMIDSIEAIVFCLLRASAAMLIAAIALSLLLRRLRIQSPTIHRVVYVFVLLQGWWLLPGYLESALLRPGCC